LLAIIASDEDERLPAKAHASLVVLAAELQAPQTLIGSIEDHGAASQKRGEPAAADDPRHRGHGGDRDQWRDYAGPDGHCIVLDTKATGLLLAEECDVRYWAHLKLDSVRYGDRPITELFPELIEAAGRTLQDFKCTIPVDRQDPATGFRHNELDKKIVIQRTRPKRDAPSISSCMISSHLGAICAGCRAARFTGPAVDLPYPNAPELRCRYGQCPPNTRVWNGSTRA
jgi:hypothetical protein